MLDVDKNTCSSSPSSAKNRSSSVLLWEAFPGAGSINLFLRGLMKPDINTMILNGDPGPSWHLLFPAVGMICSTMILLSVSTVW